MNKLIILLVFGIVFISGCEVYNTLYVKKLNKKIEADPFYNIPTGFNSECYKERIVERQDFTEEQINFDCIENKITTPCLGECEEKLTISGNVGGKQVANKEYVDCRTECFRVWDDTINSKSETKKIGCLDDSYIDTWNETICTKEILVRNLE